MRSIEGVADVHHVHFWQLNEHANAVDAHVVIETGSWGRADNIKAKIKQSLLERFDISHSTLEFECSAHACDDASKIGNDITHTEDATGDFSRTVSA